MSQQIQNFAVWVLFSTDLYVIGYESLSANSLFVSVVLFDLVHQSVTVADSVRVAYIASRFMRLRHELATVSPNNHLLARRRRRPPATNRQYFGGRHQLHTRKTKEMRDRKLLDDTIPR